MLLHHIFLALRHMVKNKTITLLNFMGLTIGLATAMVIGLHVRSEWLTDSFVPQPDRVFRAIRVSAVGEKTYEIGITSANYATALQQEFGQHIVSTTRFYPDEIFVSVGDKRFNEKKYVYADPNFFEFFHLGLLHGDPATALAHPASVVLTVPTAEKLFGSAEAAMGQLIRWNNERDMLVTGIFGGFPAASHLEFDYLGALDLFKNESWFTGWWNNNLCTYVRLAPGVSAASINAQLPRFMDKFFAADFARQGGRIDLKLQSLADVYWNAEPRYDPARHGNRRATGIFALAALMLVVIACFNFINLATSRVSERSREVGVRKAMGAGRSELSAQFMTESFLLVTASVAVAVLAAAVALPFFNRYLELSLHFSAVPWSESLGWICGLIAVVSITAGMYPAILLSGFLPARVLKQKASLSKGAVSLRRTLTVVQFSISIALIISTLVVSRQMKFIQNTDLGFDRENVVMIETYGTDIRREKLATYRQKIAHHPGVLGHTVTDAAPGISPDASIISIVGRTDRPKINVMYADFEFSKALGIPILAGRDFSAQFATDTSRAALINETACRTLGVSPEQAIGMEITPVYFDSLKHRIVGVVQDYHFLSLREKIDPLIILPDYRYPGTLAVRVSPGALVTTLDGLKNEWEQLDPAHPFEFRMLDERLSRLYKTEEKQGKLFGFFAMAAMTIACLGIFGLATLLAGQRIKEIGVRKVLGASVSGIANMLMGDFIKLVVIALVIASPFTYFFMQRWLSNFAYRIDIEWWMFAIAGLLAMVIAMATVSFQSIRAALANPVTSLRNE